MLLTSLPTTSIASVTSKLNSLLQRDFISLLPSELSIYILSFLTHETLFKVLQVSKKWNSVSQDSGVWRGSLLRQWTVRKDVLDRIVENGERVGESVALSMSDSGYQPVPSSGQSSGLASNQTFQPSQTALATLLSRRGSVNSVSSDTLGLHDSGYLEKHLGTSSQQIGSSSQPPPIDELSTSQTLSSAILNRNFLASLQKLSDKHELEILSHEKYAQIDWKYIYRQRLILERNWKSGVVSLKEFKGHEEAAYCVQFDDDKLVTGSRDSTIKVWDAKSHQLRFTLAGHTSSVLCLQFDSKYLISGSSDATIIIWDIASGKLLRTIMGHEEHVLGVKFFADDVSSGIVGKGRIVSCSRDKTVKIWRFNGKLVRTLKGHRAAVNCVALKGGVVVSASGDRTIKIWNLETGDLIRNLVGHMRGIACVQFDGKIIVSGSSDNAVKVWSFLTGQCIATLTGHSDLVRALHINSDWIVSGGYDEKVKIWDRRAVMEKSAENPSGEQSNCIRELCNGHESRVYCLQISASKVVCCTQDARILIWDFGRDCETRFF
ncbi:hypothetical protein HK098_003454 [Nowakowskiella sp. JEL0407]|nr:hypothetical protein HK098_003454 [Nowakowskiella sp. JEL0407]